MVDEINEKIFKKEALKNEPYIIISFYISLKTKYRSVYLNRLKLLIFIIIIIVIILMIETF
jgi:hypothetical protein